MDHRDLIKFIETKNLFSLDDAILLAVSGGIDSVVMAHLFHGAKFRFAIAHCNFGLRGSESDKDEEFVKALAMDLKVPGFVKKFDAGSAAAQKGISIQMAARDLRYAWFEGIRQQHGFSFVATAHHLDDQVETLLLNLIRGTGIAGLHGIPLKNNAIIRPLMFAFRKDIAQYADQRQIIYRTDKSNKETKYLRNKIRHEIIPVLSSINPDFSHGLTESIRRIGEFEQIGNQALADWRKEAIATFGNNISVDIRFLLQSDPVEPYLWGLLSPYGFTETQVTNLVGCLEKVGRKIFKSATHRLIKERGQLMIGPIEPKSPERSYKIGLFARKKKHHPTGHTLFLQDQQCQKLRNTSDRKHRKPRFC